MFAIEVTIRKAVYTAIDAARNGYDLNDIDLQETYFPRENLEDIGEKPFVKIISLGHSKTRERSLRSTQMILLNIPVQVAIQQRVDDIRDTEYLDKIVRLAEQIRETLEDDELVTGQDYSWQSTVPLQDAEGNTFSYEDLTIKGVFGIIFTLHYQFIKQP